eukprot:CAMPEP_0117496468 /NCGR_PEP_ID=MMETSP0784-20121206/20672_1 /TAXON_ID=39447 /ORGANISM="" /LENGTH=542 /DNA_ID=CAMNT_0005291439 /DNA_START=146 /DNA_END=1774 /DNA_ORIENTATION=-
MAGASVPEDEDAGENAFDRRLAMRSDLEAESFFPPDLLIDKPYYRSKKKYYIVFHIVVIFYMLLGLNTVCDAYFTGALDVLVNVWKIKPDVAGATFMAAGGSAPELFTSLIGAVAMGGSDVGFGTIVGSAVFNVLFVIGLCGLASKEAIKLTWWPLFRDCTYYIVALTILAIFAKTGKRIELWEAVLLFLGYIGYCTVMYFNSKLENMVPKQIRQEQKKEDCVTSLSQVTPVPDTGSTNVCAGADVGKEGTCPSEGSSKDQHHHHHHIRAAQPRFTRQASAHISNILARAELPSGGSSNTLGLVVEAPSSEGPRTLDAAWGRAVEAENDEEDDDDIEALMIRPDNTTAQIVWFFSLPIYAPLYFLIPKPDPKWYIATFIISLLWIAGFSLVLVYCVEILGQVLGIHIIVMGFTLLAAGTSIPDLVSSIAVARAGEGDMAVSSSIGSNIFDILVGLPIPWMIKIGIIEMALKGDRNYGVDIKSEYIVMYVLLLCVMVFCVIISIHSLGWVLNKTLGLGMAILYMIFLIIVLIVEFTNPSALKF